MERARRLHQNALEIIPNVIALEDQGVHHFTALTAIAPLNVVVHLTKSRSKIFLLPSCPTPSLNTISDYHLHLQ
jgi:hypothetical protein